MARNVEETRVVRSARGAVRTEGETVAVTNGHRVGRDRRGRGFGWLWPIGLLVLGLVALLLFLVGRGGDDDVDTGGGGGAAVRQQDRPGGSAGGTNAGGTLVAGSKRLLPVPSGNSLTDLAGRRVTGTSVPVQSVISDEAFWVGTGAQDRMLVRLERGSESPFQVRAGETVSFSGVLTQTQTGLAQQLGVTEAEGASLLVSQGAYVDVESGTLRQG